MIFTGLVGTNQHPYYYNRVSGEFRNLADRAGSYYALLPTRASRQLIFIHTGFISPPDLYRMGWDGSTVARLTWANEELRLASQAREYPVSFTLRSGKRWTGTLILPAGASFPPKNVPIVVWQEAGPGGGMGGWWTASAERPFALLPNFGIGILVVPVSGREGNGPTAQLAVRHIDPVFETLSHVLSIARLSLRSKSVLLELKPLKRVKPFYPRA